MKNDDTDIFVDAIVQYDQKHPDRRLYLAVIFQALLDATNPLKKLNRGRAKVKKLNKDRARAKKLNKDRARAWFFCSVGVTCDNFEFICDHAGIEPGYVRSFACEVINSKEQGKFRYKIYRILGKEEG